MRERTTDPAFGGKSDPMTTVSKPIRWVPVYRHERDALGWAFYPIYEDGKHGDLETGYDDADSAAAAARDTHKGAHVEIIRHIPPDPSIVRKA
jgi:hypothetical protein